MGLRSPEPPSIGGVVARGFNYAPGASAEVLEAQADDVSRERLLALGGSSNKLAREIVAARPDCPMGLLVTLAHDHVVPVRVAVAANPVALRTVMVYLSADRNTDVVLALLTNPSLPADVLDELAFHRKTAVRTAAATRLNTPATSPDEVEDFHTPELRDRAFEPAPAPPVAAPPVAAVTAPPAEVISIVTGEPVGALPAQEDFAPTVPELRAAPTRTAPVRGFRPPPAG